MKNCSYFDFVHFYNFDDSISFKDCFLNNYLDGYVCFLGSRCSRGYKIFRSKTALNEYIKIQVLRPCYCSGMELWQYCDLFKFRIVSDNTVLLRGFDNRYRVQDEDFCSLKF